MTELALMPAACYPVYPAVAARGPLRPAGAFVDAGGAWVFRHEPSEDPARLQIFHQRELVRIGEPEEVLAWRDAWAQRGLELLRGLGLDAELDRATDPFFGRGGRMLAANQRDEELKFELLVQIAGPSRPRWPPSTITASTSAPTTGSSWPTAAPPTRPAWASATSGSCWRCCAPMASIPHAWPAAVRGEAVAMTRRRDGACSQPVRPGSRRLSAAPAARRRPRLPGDQLLRRHHHRAAARLRLRAAGRVRRIWCAWTSRATSGRSSSRRPRTSSGCSGSTSTRCSPTGRCPCRSPSRSTPVGRSSSSSTAGSCPTPPPPATAASTSRPRSPPRRSIPSAAGAALLPRRRACSSSHGEDYRGVFRLGRAGAGDPAAVHRARPLRRRAAAAAARRCAAPPRDLLRRHLERRPRHQPVRALRRAADRELPALLRAASRTTTPTRSPPCAWPGRRSRWPPTTSAGCSAPERAERAAAMGEIVDGCKALSFRLARRRAFDPAPSLAAMAAAWERAMGPPLMRRPAGAAAAAMARHRLSSALGGWRRAPPGCVRATPAISDGFGGARRCVPRDGGRGARCERRTRAARRLRRRGLVVSPAPSTRAARPPARRWSCTRGAGDGRRGLPQRRARARQRVDVRRARGRRRRAAAAHNELAICCRALAPLLAVRRRPRARWRTRLVADGDLRFYRTMLLGPCPGLRARAGGGRAVAPGAARAPARLVLTARLRRAARRRRRVGSDRAAAAAGRALAGERLPGELARARARRAGTAVGAARPGTAAARSR